MHQRFSTNTFPTWQLAHPFRYLCHNGEINTVRGNQNWMHARQSIWNRRCSENNCGRVSGDSAGRERFGAIDSAVELLALAGRSLPHVMAMLIPEAWDADTTMHPDKKAFYEYHASLMEPWDGPAAVDIPRNRMLPGWLHSISPSPASGSAKTFLRLLRLSLLIDPKLESLTCIQDDVILCLNGLDYISRISVPPDVTLMTWFSLPYDYSYPPSPVQRPHPSESTLLLGQAFTLARKSVDSLLSCPRVALDWPKLHGSDEMPAWSLGDTTYATHFPNLAQHMEGENSACLMTLGNPPQKTPHEGPRTSPYFPGADFDALSLMEGK